jgi:hypothetical protein
MGNWVIICHGGADPDAGPVQVPTGSELQLWTNEGMKIKVAAAKIIVEELLRNPVDVDSLQKLIDRAWPGVKWDATFGAAGEWVTALLLHGDPDIGCVGVVDLEQRTFARWTSTKVVTLKSLLAQYTGHVHLICCRS